MARFRGSNWKKSRRLGISLSGTGKELEKRPYAPGQHGPNQRKKLSEYGLQLREKQKLRYLYGMTERLASRLDAVVYSLGLARTRRQARQLVNHGHILVDGKRVDIPSYSVKPGQTISVREKSQKLNIIVESVEINNFVPEYLNFDADSLTGTFVRLPERSELPAEINEQLIVEYYSR